MVNDTQIPEEILKKFTEVTKNTKKQIIIDFCINYLKMGNTRFKYGSIHKKYTQEAVSRTLKYIINFILITNKEEPKLMDVRVRRDRDLGPLATDS